MEDHTYYSSNSKSCNSSAKRSKLEDKNHDSNSECAKFVAFMTENSTTQIANAANEATTSSTPKLLPPQSGVPLPSVTETVQLNPTTDISSSDEISDNKNLMNQIGENSSTVLSQIPESEKEKKEFISNPSGNNITNFYNDHNYYENVHQNQADSTSTDATPSYAATTTTNNSSNIEKSNTMNISDNNIILESHDSSLDSIPDLVDTVQPSTSSGSTGTDRRESRTSFPTTIPPHMKRNYRSRRLSHVSSSSSEDSISPNARNHPITENHESEASSLHNTDFNTDSNDEFSIDSSSGSSFNFPNDTSDSDDSLPEEELNSINAVLNRTKPKHTLNLLYEVMYREHGLSGYGRGQNKRRDPLVFPNRVYSSLNVIEKLRLMHTLTKHRGCVNSLNFHRNGQYLCTGSDDLKIAIWNWASNKMLYSFHSGHHTNVFQSKFIEISNNLNIITSGRDGQIRHAHIPPYGGRKFITKLLYKHSGPVHKIAPCPNQPNEILTAGEDGHVASIDLRSSSPHQRVVSLKAHGRKLPLYSISHHPLDPQFCICGRDQFIRVYDKRNYKQPTQLLAPQHLQDHRRKPFVTHITCAVYNQSGSEIVASYSDEDIYLFHTRKTLPGGYIHRYKGYSNTRTIKGVNFFGPNSEYIISGSDCGNIFFWEKETETIVNWIHGDTSGVVNCLEPHPSFPVLATSGLDYDAKIWAPISKEDQPQLNGLEKCVKNNMKRNTMPGTDLFDDRTFFFFIRQCMRNHREGSDVALNSNFVNADSSSNDERDMYDDSDEDDNEDNAEDNMDGSCATQ